MQIRLCLERGFQRLRGDMSLTLTAVIGNSILGMIVGSVFYNLPVNTGNAFAVSTNAICTLKTVPGTFYSRGVLLFFAILLNAFSSFLEVSK